MGLHVNMIRKLSFRFYSDSYCASIRFILTPSSENPLFFLFFFTFQRKSLDRATPKLGAAIRMAMVQMMLKTLNPTRHRRSMTAAANCHCSATLSWRSCSRTRSTKNCTSTRRACSWLSTATDRISPLWACRGADLSPPDSAPQGPEAAVGGSGSEDANVSKLGIPYFEGWRCWCVDKSLIVPPTAAPSSPSPLLLLPWLVVLHRGTGSSSAVVWRV